MISTIRQRRIFGNSAVFSALHAPGRKGANSVVNILTGRRCCPGGQLRRQQQRPGGWERAHWPLSGSFDGLTEPGTYTVVVAGSLKGNSSSADFGFTVTSNLIQIGGCSVQ